jgi:hypothetical protein
LGGLRPPKHPLILLNCGTPNLIDFLMVLEEKNEIRNDPIYTPGQ